jgi:hypothetical protein
MAECYRDEEYLGCLRRNTNLCYIEDSFDEIAGTLDMGLATVSCDGLSISVDTVRP